MTELGEGEGRHYIATAFGNLWDLQLCKQNQPKMEKLWLFLMDIPAVIYYVLLHFCLFSLTKDIKKVLLIKQFNILHLYNTFTPKG